MKLITLSAVLFSIAFLANHPVISSASNILFYMPFGSISHIYSMAPLANALIDKGHNVTLLSMHVPKAVLHKKMTTFALESVLKTVLKDRPNYFGIREFSVEKFQKMIQLLTIDTCHALLTDPSYVQVAHDKSFKYDVIVMDTLMSECGLGLVAQLDSPPLIYYGTTMPYPWTSWVTNIPSPFAYVPNLMMALTDQMDFWERCLNVLMQLFVLGLRNFYMLPTVQGIVDTHYPNLPRLEEIENNMSLLLTNSYSGILDFARPLAPFVIEVGGTHCRAANSLPVDLEEFVTGAGDDGFIFFSLGSNVAGTDLDKPRRGALIKAFARLKQRILWKFEENITDLPSNVRVQNWAPQQDLLGHPNIKAFFTHGGQLSIQEAVYHGVPMLGLPVMGDQMSNIKNIVAKGIAEEIDHSEINEEMVYNKLYQLVTNASYKETSKKYSQLIKDHPVDALDNAIYWVEYVIRHNGTKHLRLNAADRLNFFQYFLLDVISVILFSCMAILFSISFILWRFCFKTAKGKLKVQ